MILINEIYINFYLKNNNLISCEGTYFLVIFIKNKSKLSILLLKLGFHNKIIISILIK